MDAACIFCRIASGAAPPEHDSLLLHARVYLMMRWLGASSIRWGAFGAALLLLMLALPLALFALVSYFKLGFMSLSWYVPYEEFGQSLASGELHRIYYAPLAAINTTSGFVIATMFTQSGYSRTL